MGGEEVSPTGWITNVGKQLVAQRRPHAAAGWHLVMETHVRTLHAYHSRILHMTVMAFTTCQESVQTQWAGTKKERKRFPRTSSLFPPSHLCAFSHRQKSLPPLCLQTFFLQSTAGIPSLDLILESAGDDRNVAKKRMVSVVTNTTPAIVCSNVGSQVPHLQSLPPLSEYIWEHHVLNKQ